MMDAQTQTLRRQASPFHYHLDSALAILLERNSQDERLLAVRAQIVKDGAFATMRQLQMLAQRALQCLYDYAPSSKVGPTLHSVDYANVHYLMNSAATGQL